MAQEINTIIRQAEKKDCKSIASLIMELAVFEKMPEQAKLTEQDLIRDGFETSPPLFRSLVAEENGQVVGFTLFYTTYSTWRGKCMYLEDFYVQESCRNRAVGSKLFDAVAKLAVEENCYRVDFEVLGWNPAKTFYARKGARNMTETEDWLRYRLDNENLQKLVNNLK